MFILLPAKTPPEINRQSFGRLHTNCLLEFAKTITTNEEIEAYFRTCERMIQEETIAIEDENISNFIFLPAEDIFDLVGETEHPANNEDAKWAIKDLFKPLDIL